MTKAKAQILAVYRKYAKIGIAPSLSELANDLKLSKTTVHEHVAQMVDKGLLNRVPSGAYSKYLLPSQCPTCGAKLAGEGKLRKMSEPDPRGISF